ncbi:MAG: S24/S26 family peptidase [Fibrobacter sp.]|nr:S24/S26 family peptidase [Fibrobacter sp.]
MASDESIMQEAIRLVSEGVSVTFPVNGRSMLPFIVGGVDSVVLVKSETLKVGDVVLAQVEGGRYVVHRIVCLNGDAVTLMGDGNLAGREHCRLADVRARATHVVGKGGKRRSLDSLGSRLAAKIWYAVLPFRRWLLAIYRRIPI